MGLAAAATRFVFKLPGMRRQERAARTLILAYHRVAALACDPIPIAVSPKHFSEQLAVLVSEYEPLSLRALVDASRRNGIRDKSVVVTFDDGYADNLNVATPLLESHRVPATVFVTAGMVGGPTEFWWDELETLVLAPARLQADLELSVRGERLHFGLLGDAGRPMRGRHLATAWNTLSRRTPTARHALYRELLGVLRSLRAEEREEILGDLRRWCGGAGPVRSTHRALTSDELRSLAQHPLVEVGAHTRSHTRLAELSLAEQRDEVVSSKDLLERLVGRPVESFAYPFGAPGDYAPSTVAVVREAGFLCACANFAAGVEAGTDLFQLPRFLVRDWDGQTFARVLRRWLAS